MFRKEEAFLMILEPVRDRFEPSMRALINEKDVRINRIMSCKIILFYFTFLRNIEYFYVIHGTSTIFYKFTNVAYNRCITSQF